MSQSLSLLISAPVLTSSALALERGVFPATHQSAVTRVEDFIRRHQPTAPLGLDSEGNLPEERLFKLHGGLGGARIPVGKLLFGQLIHDLVVSGEESPLLIELDEAQGALSGLRILGGARASTTTGRIALDFRRLLLRSQRAIPISAVGLDEDGALAIPAEVFSSKALLIAGGLAGSFVTGMASAQQTQIPNNFGFSSTAPTARNSLLQGVAQVAADQSKRLIEEATAEKPILKLKAHTSVTVLIQEEVKW